MSVVECDVPSESALGKALIERADFSDAYRAPLRRPDAGVTESAGSPPSNFRRDEVPRLLTG